MAAAVLGGASKSDPFVSALLSVTLLRDFDVVVVDVPCTVVSRPLGGEKDGPSREVFGGAGSCVVLVK